MMPCWNILRFCKSHVRACTRVDNLSHPRGDCTTLRSSSMKRSRSASEQPAITEERVGPTDLCHCEERSDEAIQGGGLFRRCAPRNDNIDVSLFNDSGYQPRP